MSLMLLRNELILVRLAQLSYRIIQLSPEIWRKKQNWTNNITWIFGKKTHYYRQSGVEPTELFHLYLEIYS